MVRGPDMGRTRSLGRIVARGAGGFFFGVCALSFAWAATDSSPSATRPAAVGRADQYANLSAEQIVEKNVAARGGLEAWRNVKTMGWVGRLESPASQVPMMPFLLEQKRPNKTHFEVSTMGQRSVRVFDGLRGWRSRPSANGGPADVQPFNKDEVKFARGAQGIDGPLIDYASKGNKISLAGIEEVEGRKNYRISVVLPSGERNDVWIDAQTFLDTKYDRTTYNEKGVPGRVTVFYREYKAIKGLQIPAILEIGAGSARMPDKMIIEKVAINPPIEDKEFSRPGGMKRSRMATIDVKPEDVFPNMRGAPPGAPAAPAAVAPPK